MPPEDYSIPYGKAVLVPSGDQDIKSVVDATTLLCVHRVYTKYDECVYDRDEFYQPMEPKTKIRYKTDTIVYLIDLTSEHLFASKEFPSEIRNCPFETRFEEGEKIAKTYFGAVDPSLIYEWADRIWK